MYNYAEGENVKETKADATITTCPTCGAKAHRIDVYEIHRDAHCKHEEVFEGDYCLRSYFECQGEECGEQFGFEDF